MKSSCPPIAGSRQASSIGLCFGTIVLVVVVVLDLLELNCRLPASPQQATGSDKRTGEGSPVAHERRAPPGSDGAFPYRSLFRRAEAGSRQASSIGLCFGTIVLVLVVVVVLDLLQLNCRLPASPQQATGYDKRTAGVHP